MTNANKVRDMTDEELLELHDTPCPPRHWDLFKKGIKMPECPTDETIKTCKECWTAWMKEEAKE